MTGLNNGLLALTLCAGFLPGVAFAVDNNGGGVRPADAGIHTLLPSTGHTLCSAAINSNGTVATRLGGTINESKTFKLSTGTYQVGFLYPCGNVQIQNGWLRVIQPDTLTFGTLPARMCTVADRAGEAAAVWVQCFDAAGNLVDTSFTVQISR